MLKAFFMGFKTGADFFLAIKLDLLADSFQFRRLVLQLDVLITFQDPVHEVLLAKRFNSSTADVSVEFFANYNLRKQVL